MPKKPKFGPSFANLFRSFSLSLQDWSEYPKWRISKTRHPWKDLSLKKLLFINLYPANRGLSIFLDKLGRLKERCVMRQNWSNTRASNEWSFETQKLNLEFWETSIFTFATQFNSGVRVIGSSKQIVGSKKKTTVLTVQWTFQPHLIVKVSSENKTIQYVVLGLQLKIIQIIIMNILPESKHNELKYSLKIAFMFLSIIVKVLVPKWSLPLVTREKATMLNGAWCATRVSSQKKKHKNMIASTRKREFHNISRIFSILNAIKL